MFRIHVLGWRQLAVCAALLAAACNTATPSPTVAPTSTVDSAATEAAGTAEAIQVAEREEAQVATGVAATLTAAPTNTPTETDVPTATPTATKKPTSTPTDTPEATATLTRTPGPTHPPVTNTPTAKPTSDSVYGFTGGIAGYATDIQCTYAGGACITTMPQGDISFEFLLGSAADTPLTLFEKYGLSVERDGANVADMFMFVDAGLLPPDTVVWFGASRNFNIPGRYVVRSSGCLTTVPAPCGWNTMMGTTVTFTIK